MFDQARAGRKGRRGAEVFWGLLEGRLDAEPAP